MNQIELVEKAVLLVEGHSNLISAIRNALSEHAAVQLEGREDGAEVWQNKVLPMIVADHSALLKSVHEAKIGNSQELTEWAADKLGLSKDLDNCPFGWMSNNASHRVRSAIGTVVGPSMDLYYKLRESGA